MNESSPSSVFYQMIQVLGFHDVSSFILVLVFGLLATAFVISSAVFLVKKRRERMRELERVVHEVQEPLIAAKAAEEELLEVTPDLIPKPEPIEEPEPETERPPQEPEPRPEPETEPHRPEPEPVPEPETLPAPEREHIEPEVVHKPEAKKSLGAALKNTRGGFIEKIARLFSRGHEISDADFEAMEAILFTADIGAKTAQKLLDNLRARVKAHKISDKAQVQGALKEEMRAILSACPYHEPPVSEAPRVFMFVGVNGAGKTTSIAKLGARLASEGKSVVFGAGDTFRAAAVKQLSVWGEREGIPVVSGKEGADSAAVLFEAIAQGKRNHADAVLCDTAGRLHTKTELMEELKKVHRVVNKAHAGAPHEVLLVIDATMGQNAIAQAREFAAATPLTGVVLSKLDGTAKGGVALGIVDELKVPIRFIGIGEQASDLKDFDADQFVDALFDEN